MRSVTDLPLAVGFGIATADHAAQVGAIADAVVVGSAIVRTVEKYANDPALESKLEALASELKSGLKRART
jgi:tryptophan synthase alpha chain